ncbi:ABC transporter permease [Neolewinella aurantiaca]|uniref:ABC transporter permease n=1 Tax=Neolewinella aurantiaca TaxID=2602767 RepID=A0A5C7FMM5_9BACT|nr:ABC transporter permease [Neolewinella aurantiaca]TXF91382.1 ABC transporter permease [Neolewinella aurantiaca]
MFSAFSDVFSNLRTNFFQTFLSVLGIIIGVGALVAMLSMIDGLELYAKEMIAEKSSLENLVVKANTGTRIDGIYTERDTAVRLDAAIVDQLLDSLPYKAEGQLTFNTSSVGYTPDSTKIGLRIQAFSLPVLNPLPDSALLHGRLISDNEVTSGARLLLASENVARRVVGKDGTTADAIGQHLHFFGDSLEIAGIIKSDDEENFSIAFPLAAMAGMTKAPTPDPVLNIALADVNDVLDAEEFTNAWFRNRYPAIDKPVETSTYTGYLEQLAQGISVFRWVMGFIIGIAVVVGGVGVMNVLLMSIAERTPEIGVRKAVGANRRDIIGQFLSESIAISAIGSFFGVLLGMAVAFIAAPILNMIVDELEFRVVFSFNTILVVSVVALLIGVVFGTYPAKKAAGLDPVEAIRR